MKLTLQASGIRTPGSTGGNISHLLGGLGEFSNTKNNCDEIWMVAYHKGTVASVFIGLGLGKPTVASALEAVSRWFQLQPAANRTIAQLCGGGRIPARTLGLAVDTTDDLLWVRKMGAAWRLGECATVADTGPDDWGTLPIKVFDIAAAPLDTTDYDTVTTVSLPQSAST